MLSPPDGKPSRFCRPQSHPRKLQHFNQVPRLQSHLSVVALPSGEVMQEVCQGRAACPSMVIKSCSCAPRSQATVIQLQFGHVFRAEAGSILTD